MISSAPVNAVQYHTSLSSLTVRGVRTDQQSRSRHRFPAPFEFVAQDAGAASLEVAVDELEQCSATYEGRYLAYIHVE